MMPSKTPWNTAFFKKFLYDKHCCAKGRAIISYEKNFNCSIESELVDSKKRFLAETHVNVHLRKGTPCHRKIWVEVACFVTPDQIIAWPKINRFQSETHDEHTSKDVMKF